MASALTFDELNRLDYEGRRSEDYEEYFSGMGLTKQQIGERIELAKNFEKELMPVLIYLNTLREYSLIDEEDAANRFNDAFISAVGTAITIDSRVQELADDFSSEVAKSTVSHKEDPYYFSLDRAMFMSENESETSYNYKEFDDAVMSGKQYKEWVDMKDKYVRDTHEAVGGTIKKINEPFLVGDSLMMYPKDTSYDADASEIVNCRCIAKYF